MVVNWKEVACRVSTLGPDGKLLSAITGEEPDAALREMAFKFANKCLVGKSHAHCPFFAIGGLSNPAILNLINTMDRHSLLGLFELECECRNSPSVLGQNCKPLASD